MVKVIDMISNETGEILGYFKKAENEVNWTWIMYARDCVPVVIDAQVPTYKLVDWTRATKKNELWANIDLSYRLIKVWNPAY